jgi:CHAT domain-containing protein/Flp pilus assembly protein TadD
MHLRSRLLSLITLLAATSGVVPANFPAPFSALPVIAQASTERKAEADRLLQQGIEQYKTSQFQAATQSWQQALAIYREIGNRQGEANSLTGIGVAYSALGQYQQAIELYQQSLAIQQTIGDRSGEANSLGNLGNAYSALGQYQKAIELYQQSLAIQQAIGDSPNGDSFASRSGEANSLSHLGNAYSALGQYQQAIEFYQQSLAIARTSGDRSREASSLNNLGIAYDSLGQYQKAIDFYRQSLAIARISGDRQVEANSLGNLGNTYDSLGQYQRAIEFYQQSLAIQQAIGHRQGEANSLGNLGNAYDSLGQYQRAIEFHQQSLAIAREIGDRSGEANSLGNLGIAYGSLGEYQKAIEFYQQSLAIVQEIGNRRGIANSLMGLGNTYGSLGQYQKAIEFYQQSLAIQQAIGDRSGEANSLGNLGIAHGSLGQYQKAIEFYRQALAIQRAIGNRSGEANSLGNLGIAHGSLGQYQRAIEFYGQSLAIQREIGDRQGEANSLNNLGNAHSSLGQYQKAIEFYQQSLAIKREIGDHSGEANSLIGLGDAYNFLEQYQRAIEFHQQSLAIAQEIGDRSGEANSLIGLGDAYNFLEQYQRAIEFSQQSLALTREIGDRSGEAASLNNLGDAYDSLGQYQKAIEFHQQSLAIFREIGVRSGEGISLSNLGELLAEQNQPELAIVFLKQSVNVREAIRRDIQGLPQEQQQSYTETIADDYRRLADLLLQQNRILEAQLVLDLLKVQELDDYLRGVRGNTVTASGIEFWQPELEILERYNAQQATAIALGQELTQLRQILEENRTAAQQQRINELVQLEKELKSDFNDFIENEEIVALVEQLSRRVQRQNLNLEDIAALRDNLKTLDAVLLYPLILENRLELVITTPDSPPLRRTVEGVGREQLNEVILAFRQALQSPPSPSSDALTPAQQLYQWLIEPLENDLAQANPQTIIYAPDGQLRYIPLAALHDGEQWLAQRYQVNNITAQSLTELDTQPQSQPSVLAGAFADTTISHPVQIGQQQVRMSGLPFAGQEVETLVATLPDTTSYFDQDFSLKSIESRLNEHDIIHFATHAAFVPGKPEDSFILFGNGDRPTLADIKNWSLQNVDLVVLSACETGLGGQLGNGEEILGLGYQFQRAGARATIASLWQVSDGGTQALMNSFYEALQGENITKAEALRQAQIALITGDYTALGDRRGSLVVEFIGNNLPKSVQENLSHPYYWAPFILIGNGL